MGAKKARHYQAIVRIGIFRIRILLAQRSILVDCRDATITYQDGSILDKLVLCAKRDNGPVANEDICH